MKPNGCFNHKPYADSFSSYGLDPKTGEIREFVVPNPNTKNCNYSTSNLGEVDKGCIGCAWKEAK